MAAALPPQQTVVEYRIEDHRGISSNPAMVQAMRMVADARRMAVGRGADAMRPPLDPRSTAYTPAERKALEMAGDAIVGDRLQSTRIVMPKGYVAERIRDVMQRDRVADHLAGRDSLSAAQIHAYQCHRVAVALDRRAGSYVVGGEAAAEAARRAVPRTLVEECAPRGVAAQASSLSPSVRPSQRVGVSPSSAKGPGATLRLDPVGARSTSIMPVALSVTRIDPNPSVRTSIDPKPSVRTRIDPVRIAGFSKGPASAAPVDAAAAFAARRADRGI